VRERKKGTETVNAHMYLRTLWLKCELCQLPSYPAALIKTMTGRMDDGTDDGMDDGTDSGEASFLIPTSFTICNDDDIM
jgi:hypothetical protein